MLYDNHTRAIINLEKPAFCNTNNTVSDYFHLKTDFIMNKRQKVVRLWPHLSHCLLCPCLKGPCPLPSSWQQYSTSNSTKHLCKHGVL